MKRLILSLAAAMFLMNLSGQTITPEGKNLVESFVKNNIDIQYQDIDQSTVNKVFSGTFYIITVGFNETGTGASSCGSDNFINLNGNTVKMIEPVHMDLECPVLMSLIKKDFLLKDENGAKLFEAALNVLYPVDDNEKQNVKHLRKDTQWIFLRGKFFDDYTAIIVTTGPTGAVSKVELKLAYTVN
ncbi:MAG TPA: hypothetical protein VK213_11545 [Bacteroidales bacterium]|nr:hypothetical protein [Bacteroidales bacterium]